LHNLFTVQPSETDKKPCFQIRQRDDEKAMPHGRKERKLGKSGLEKPENNFKESVNQ
jgi:hypothetical protein